MNDSDKPSARDQQTRPPTGDEPKKAGAQAARHAIAGKDLIIVGIGASAGGLDALQRVLPGLPAKAGMAYIIVQHLAPKHRSLLSSLLAKHTEMAVETIRDGMPVRPDTIYITPPNRDVTLSGQRLHLSTPAAIGPRPSVDHFFISLAEVYRKGTADFQRIEVFYFAKLFNYFSVSFFPGKHVRATGHQSCTCHQQEGHDDT